MTTPAPRVDWAKFYRFLSSLAVPMPTPSPGEPMDIDALRELLLRVQTNRQRLDHQARKLDQRLGSLRAQLDVLTETKRIERAQAMQEPSLYHARSAGLREAIIETRTAPISARIAHTRAMIHQYEAAKEAADSTTKTLELAKQTVNSLKQITLAEFDVIDDTGAPSNPRSRFIPSTSQHGNRRHRSWQAE